MPTPTYTPLAELTLGSSAASVTFSSISQAYRDLVLISTASLSSGSGEWQMRVNGDTGTNYNNVVMIGNGSTGQSFANANINSLYVIPYMSFTTGLSQMRCDFLDYSATDKHKTILNRGDRADTATIASANRWASTSAITSIVLFPNTSTFAAGSTFALYGIAA